MISLRTREEPESVGEVVSPRVPLIVRNARKSYQAHGWGRKARRKVALDGVSLSAEPGRTLGLVGQSGSGKTTLARAIAGLIALDEGEILLGDRGLSPAAFRRDMGLRRAVQMVFQDPFQALNPRRTIRQSLLTPVRNFRIDASEGIDSLLTSVLSHVEMENHVLEKYPTQLSGGECQRVAVARALLPSPTFLLLDEAVASLDVITAASLLDLFRRLRTEGTTSFIFISHDLGLVSEFADVVAVMHRGVVEELLDPGDGRPVWQEARSPYTRELLRASEEVIFTDSSGEASTGTRRVAGTSGE